MLVVMDKPIHEKPLTLLLQTNSKQFKLAITFLTESNGIFNVTNKRKQILNLQYQLTTMISIQ